MRGCERWAAAAQAWGMHAGRDRGWRHGRRTRRVWHVHRREGHHALACVPHTPPDPGPGALWHGICTRRCTQREREREIEREREGERKRERERVCAQRAWGKARILGSRCKAMRAGLELGSTYVDVSVLQLKHLTLTLQDAPAVCNRWHVQDICCHPRGTKRVKQGISATCRQGMYAPWGKRRVCSRILGDPGCNFTRNEHGG